MKLNEITDTTGKWVVIISDRIAEDEYRLATTNSREKAEEAAKEHARIISRQIRDADNTPKVETGKNGDLKVYEITPKGKRELLVTIHVGPERTLD